MNFITVANSVEEVQWLRGPAKPMRHNGLVWLDEAKRTIDVDAVRGMAMTSATERSLLVLDIESLPTTGVPDSIADANANMLADIAAIARGTSCGVSLSCYAVPPFYGPVGNLAEMRNAVDRVQRLSSFLTHLMPSAYMVSNDAKDGLRDWCYRMMWRLSMCYDIARRSGNRLEIVPLLFPYFQDYQRHDHPIPLDLLEQAAAWLVGMCGNIGWWPDGETCTKYGGDPALPWRDVARRVAQRGRR